MKTIAQLLNMGRRESEYSDPRWRELSKRIRSERGNQCQCCRTTDSLTHVHHVVYEPGKRIWEADPNDLAVLCESCHRELHVQLNNFRKYVFRYLKPNTLRVLNGSLSVAVQVHDDQLRVAYAIAEMVSTKGSIERFCNAWINRSGDKQ